MIATTVDPQETPALLAEPADFSLVLGGPMFQLLRGARLSDDVLTLVHRRILAAVLVTWLPLLLLSAWEGRAWGGDIMIPFLLNAETHARLLLALPLLLGAELVVHLRMRRVVAQFLARGLIAERDRLRFNSVVESAMRLRNSLAAELLLVVLVYGLGLLSRDYIAVDASTWASGTAAGNGSGFDLSAAGWWQALVSLPVFQFLLLRWYFRLFIWARFLWQVSRIELQLVPTHPDRAGGLGFLANVVYAFTLVLLAHGVLLAGLIADRIFFGGATLTQFTLEIVACRGPARVRGALPAHGVCGTARTRQARGPRRVRRARAALRQGVRHEMGARRPRPGRTAHGQRRHPVACRPGEQLRGDPDHADGAVLEGDGVSAGGRHPRAAPATHADDDLARRAAEALAECGVLSSVRERAPHRVRRSPLMTRFSQLLDPIPVTFVFVGFIIVALVTSEIGFRIGRWWQLRSPGQQEGPTEMLVGSILAMLAFLLAVTMGMASDRFDARRVLVRDEANSIGTTFLRAGYLAEPYGKNIQNLLREYVPLRIESRDETQLEADYARSKTIHDQLWTQTTELVRQTPDTEVKALFIVSVNELIDLHTTRMTSRIYSRVPESVVLALLIGAVLTMGVVGYNAGLTTRRGMLGAVVLIVALGSVITLVIDLDRPREGFLQVSQQPLIDLHEDLGDPRP